MKNAIAHFNIKFMRDGTNQIHLLRAMIDVSRIKALLRECVADLAPYLFPNGHRDGVHWCVGSINGEPGKSFKLWKYSQLGISDRSSDNILEALWF